MRRDSLRRLGALRALAVFAAIAATLTAAAAGGLEGSWELVEQRYQNGSGALASAGVTLRLEFPAGEPARVSIRFGRGEKLEWPAVVSDAGPVAVEVIERRVDRVAGLLHARYSLRAPEGDGWSLEMSETYRLSEEDDLEGTLEVRMLRDDRPNGGYVLTRRFERRR